LAIEYRLYFTLPHLSTAAVPTLGAVTVMPVSLDESMRGLQVASMETTQPYLGNFASAVCRCDLGMAGNQRANLSRRGRQRALQIPL
jgi:hypothetical protein